MKRKEDKGGGVVGTTPQEALARLDEHAAELDRLSNGLAQSQRELEGVEREYEDFVDAYVTGLYLQSDGARLPALALQVKLARREMPPELLGRYDGLVQKRGRMRQRISDLKAIIEAERSVLSALKIVAEV